MKGVVAGGLFCCGCIVMNMVCGDGERNLFGSELVVWWRGR